jgi:type I restriction enzyme M protein
MMEALAPGGHCAVVVPEGLLFGSTAAHTDLRKKLVEDFHLLAIVSLPAGVFKPYAGVKTGVLVFRRPEAVPHKKGPHSRKVWFYEVRADGFDPDRIVEGGRPETPDRNDIPDLLENWAKYRSSKFTEPPGVEAGKILSSQTIEPRCWWTTVDAIAENNYHLAASRYKPQIAQDLQLVDPGDLIRKTLDLETDISTGLKKLLDQLEVAE